ncbi:hypothetical protein OG298_28630 [Streptomyces sp. NBC_01005]|uniref:hypothetical protein n=1 Tax=unclassified Streptomyces TaxID=2593676 RepID=UPI002E3304DB|nr:hypothetical protein [Streptomyces sp. NBC_01362]WSW08019.1 hypothetical protein OG298_28630 [Streptomyces sp. NBC_01005]WTC97529.1 hypothetical protein OH736_28645 [Streptomyces sp. NBC_01650]
MSVIVEWVFLALAAAAGGSVARGVVRRRAVRRAAAAEAGESFEIPSRVAWVEVTGRKGMVYGKLAASRSGVAFARRFRDPVVVPEATFVKTEPSRRGGLVVLHYRSADGSGIRILVAEAEAVTVRRLLSP